MERPHHLRVEHLGDAVLGIGTGAPRLSWWLPDGAVEQRRYRIAIDADATDWIDASESVLVPWPGAAVLSQTRAEWRVQVATDAGESPWSHPAWFETGLLGAEDWTAVWIESPGVEPAGASRPAQLVRCTFVLDRVPDHARLYATAHGIYETFLNGRRVGDQELTPGFTSYWDHLDVQTHDVSSLLVQGENEWTATLTDGWFRGRVGNNQDVNTFGDRLAFLAQLQAGDRVVATGAEWTATTGPILSADLMDGQYEDRRLAPGDWQPASIADHGYEHLTASPAPPTRRVQDLRPVEVRRVDSDRQVVDLGQNVHGWLRLADLGPSGTDITLVHGEALDDGHVTLEHLCLGETRLGQTDRVVSAGRPGDVFEPRHTSHGFRYASIEGHPGRLTVDDVTGIVVHTDLRRTGWFRCSDDRINRLHEITDWSFRDNACEIPTDCPQRERSGWTGDWQVFLESAAFLYDVAGFSRKWLRSLAADQLGNGCLTNMAPEPRRASGATDDIGWVGMLGSAGWGDASVLVPWRLHAIYGDGEVLEVMWPTMTRWVDYAASVAREGRHPSRAQWRPEPAPYERYLWDSGWHWGEWLEPGNPAEPFWQADQGHVATAFLHHSSSLVARIGRMLGHQAVADTYDELSARALGAWRAEYLSDDGTVTPDSQATLVRALRFGLVPDELRAATAKRLVELVRESGTHLSTGFLATGDLLPVLADHGHTDVAYDLLFQDTSPSWLTMVERGATTVWENWEGIAEDGSARDSLNHYSKGAVISFLHTHAAGIQLVDGHPAYRRFRIAPQPDRRLDWVEATHDSPYGRIESSWSVRDDRFELVATVPPGTSAEIRLPDGTRREQTPGTATYRCPVGVKSSRST